MPARPWPSGHLSVLIVDDLQELREMYSRYFRFAGVGVTTAIDGSEALQLSRRFPPDALVLDLSMPGMSGWQLLEEWRGDPALADIPVIVLTAYGTEADALAAGADAFLEKPCLPASLLQAVRRVTAGRPALT